MKTALRIFLLAGAAGLGFWLWMTLFPSPEKIVLKKRIGGDVPILRQGAQYHL